MTTPRHPLRPPARPISWCCRVAAAALFALAWAGLEHAQAQPAAPPSPPPIRAFFDNATFSEVELSPSGKHLAMTVVGKDGRTLLAVVDVAMSEKPQAVAAASFADIRSFAWVDDDWLVYNVIDAQSAAYDQSFGPGLFSVRRDGTQSRVLVRPRWDPVFSTGTSIASRELAPNHRLLRVLRDGSQDVIVGEYRFNNRYEIEGVVPKRLNVANGIATPIAQGAPAHAYGWVFDKAGVPRAATTEHDGSVEIYWRDSADAPWQSLHKSGLFNVPWFPWAVDADNRLYVRAESPALTAVLKRFDFTTGRPEAEPLASAPGFDLTGALVFDDGRQRLVGVRVVTDAETTVWFDPERKRLQALADARFPGRVNRISCGRCEGGGPVLVHSYADHDPGSWSVYQPESDRWTVVGAARPAIDPRQMADLDLHRFKARDGLEIPVWVTRPKGASGPLPAVLLVHGGPWVRGVRWGWSAEAQFFASRGYAVIEPEFRGSTGYGRRLYRAGWKHWGTTMQDDLADAVRWAADKRFIDPARTCIAGASYGGYAALMAPIRYPDMFKCSVAWVAVSDPRLLFADIWNSDASEQAIRYSMPTLIGDPVRDAEMLKAAAPLERAAEVKVPLLLAYGREDQRVPLVHGERMRAALKAAGNDPQYIVYDNEGHGFLKPENRFDFYGRVEKFLQQHIGGNAPH